MLFRSKPRGITIADDYAHHPAELEATLTAAKEMNFNHVWAVFQPFTYSRTAMLLNDFARVLALADRVVMTEIMGSREINTYNIYTKDLADKIPGSVWFNTFEEVADYVVARAEPCLLYTSSFSMSRNSSLQIESSLASVYREAAQAISRE